MENSYECGVVRVDTFVLTENDGGLNQMTAVGMVNSGQILDVF